MNIGYISLHRKIQDCFLWYSDEPFDRRSAWIDLLLLVNHEEKEIVFDGNKIVVSKGQKITSIRFLANRWHWSTTKVRKYLELLKSENMIEIESDNKKTLLTVVNYEFYQNTKHTENTQKTHRNDSEITQKIHENDAEITQKNTNNNDNNVNNVNNENNDNKKNKESIDDLIEQNFETLWKLYPRKEGKSSVSKKTKKEIYKVGYDKMAKCIELFIADMKEQNRDLQYYPQGSTFFNTKYKDYLEKLEEKEKRESEILEKQSEEDIEESDDDDGWEKLYDENTTFDWGNF